MTRRILIAGSGFAGTWAALAAMRVLVGADAQDGTEVVVVSPEPSMTIRPRLYEADLAGLAPDVGALLQAVGVRHLTGEIEAIDVEGREVRVRPAQGGAAETLTYDRFVLATGSRVFMPAVPGVAGHSFNVDSLAAAEALDAHLRALAAEPPAAARDTVVVVGGGATGLEAATEMPARLRALFGPAGRPHVLIVDSAPQVGAPLGAAPLPHITEALSVCGVEACAGVRVTEVDADGVGLSDGRRIATRTVIWAAGIRAQSLAAQIPGAHDELGRVIGDAQLRAPAAPGVFVTGDCVKVPTDAQGNFNVMSCQHALSLGRVAGHNAAADLLGLPLHAYSQPKYVTCLDLGAWGALFTEGWDRQVRFTKDEGKRIKIEINTRWIYPPTDRDEALRLADPAFVVVA